MKRAMFNFAEISDHIQKWEDEENMHTQSGVS